MTDLTKMLRFVLKRFLMYIDLSGEGRNSDVNSGYSLSFLCFPIETDIPFDEYSPSTILKITFVSVYFNLIHNKSPQLQIMLNQIAHLLKSANIFPSLEPDYIIPTSCLVALTCI
jgi:hypothetical protein